MANCVFQTLQVGSAGPEQTKILQHFLGIKEDGIYGTVTKAAVMAWQKKHGLVQDGIAGPVTCKAMGIWCTSPTPVITKPAWFLQLETNLKGTINSMNDLYNLVISAYKRNGSVYNHIACMQGATLNTIVAGVNKKYSNCARWSYLGMQVAIVLKQDTITKYVHVDCNYSNGKPDLDAGHYLLIWNNIKYDLAHAASSGGSMGTTMCINGYNSVIDNKAPCP